MFGSVAGRARIARKEYSCVACDDKIKIGELYMQYVWFVMQGERIHIECFAFDHDESYLIAVDDKPVWNCDVVRVNRNNLQEAIIKIKNAKNIPTLATRCDPHV